MYSSYLERGGGQKSLDAREPSPAITCCRNGQPSAMTEKYAMKNAPTALSGIRTDGVTLSPSFSMGMNCKPPLYEYMRKREVVN